MSSHRIEDFALISQLYSGIYSPVVPEQGTSKPRRRRRTNKGAAGLTEAKKRKLSPEQANLLELNFGNEHKLESERKDKLALELGLDPRQVAVWFQNRRARWKNKKLEEEYSKVKSAHESVVVEKCRLESEILKLKGELSNAKKEVQQLSERVEGFSSNNSPSPSVLSMYANIDTPFFGEFGMENYENVFYLPESSYILGMEWVYNM